MLHALARQFPKAACVAILSGDLVTGIAIDVDDLFKDTKLAIGSDDLGPTYMLFT